MKLKVRRLGSCLGFFIALAGCKTTSSTAGLRSTPSGTDCDSIWRDLQADPQSEGGSLRQRYAAECSNHRPSVAVASGTDCDSIWRDLKADPQSEGGSLRQRYDAECGGHRPGGADGTVVFRTFAKCGEGTSGAWRFELDESTSSAAARLRFASQEPLTGRKDNPDERDPISFDYSFGGYKISIRPERQNDRYPALLSLPDGKVEKLDCFLP